MKFTINIGLFLSAFALSAGAVTHQYLFVGHPRSDGPGQIVQREVERIDFAQYDLLMLGGDYTLSGTGTRETVDYLDAIFDFGHPATLAALGNHDKSHRNYFTDVSGRPTYYATQTNGITFAVLDTTDDSQSILGGELQMLQDTVNSLSNSTHLVLIHHHFVWMADYAPLDYLYGDERIGASSATLSGKNFYSDVYPLLLQAVSNGVEVICVAGDRTGNDSEPFYIEHTTADGIHYLAAGLKEDPPANLRTAIEFEHDMDAGTLTWNFVLLTELPRIPDEPLVISEIHYNPSAGQGDDTAFIELINRSDEAYDLSEAVFSQGVSFAFPTNTVIAPGERILVAADPAHYTHLDVRIFDYDGSSRPVSGQPIWLRDRWYLEVDYVSYDTAPPWTPEPDGNGPTLALIRPDLDAERPENWTASDGAGGTPGAINFAAPICTNISVAANEIAMDWRGAVDGGQYQLEWTPTLMPVEWQPIVETHASAGTLPLPATNNAPTGFYRLLRVFPPYVPPVYTNLIAQGAIWKYRDTGDDPGTNWMTMAYDDSGWAAGPAELGYGDGDEATVVGYGPNENSKYATTHFRHHFNVDDPAGLGDVRLRASIDDGAIFYLNGTEVARLRMGPGPITYLDYSGGDSVNNSIFEPVELSVSEFRAGDNVLAVEVHQRSADSSDISMDVELLVSGKSTP